MDKNFCIYDIGFSYVLSFNLTTSALAELESNILDNKSSAFMINEWAFLPFDSGTVTVFLFRTTHRKAYDLYYKFNGKFICPISAECIGSMLNASGQLLSSIHEPRIYNMENSSIYHKKEEVSQNGR